MITKDELLRTGNQERIWQKYCGFLDLSLTEFMEMQEELLMEQIELVYDSPLARKFMQKKPEDVSEFRRLVPLTTYDDYADYLNAKNEDVLAVKPYCWGRTSGRGGTFKWVPYTERAVERFIMLSAAMTILACASRKGEVNVASGVRMLHSLPPPPYMSGILLRPSAELWDARLVPPLDKYEDADFATLIEIGFRIALRTGVDTLSALTSVLVKMGERFTESSGQLKFNRHMLHPQTMWRLIIAWLRSKREGRTLLPKDLWPLKGLICYGTDTAIYREQLIHYWGKVPFEVYAATEAGLIAFHAWNKKSMTFIPSSCFLEFIPEAEWLKSRENKDYQPSTILLDEVKPGERYEIIVTSLYGMPFLRYRLGDLIKIVALEDEEAGIKLPQMVFESRSDGLIDIAGFPRLDEKTIWQAIANTGIKYEDWSVRKEYEQNEPIVRLYIELKEEREAAEVERLIHRELVSLNPDYRDLENMLGIRPLRVTLLPAGSFQRYYEAKQKSGAHLAHLKPPHMNAPDTVIQNLVKLGPNPARREL
jgi:hypothetical protein